MKVNLVENIVEIELENKEKKYMIIFPDKNKSLQCKNKLESDIKEDKEFDKYICSLNYKVILDEEHLLLINQAANKTPDIYKIAVNTGVDQVILVN